ncbi:hypothetical protein ACIQVL_48920 [Streptomyces sp. NPDC090499]|uniref:DUF6197 family protein n=1 Tax=Streptomyces sp. NPDC090499 TaxID=3365965 RepID=UPI00382B52CF
MQQTRPTARPRTAPPPAAPGRAPLGPRSKPAQAPPAAPDWPSRWHLLIPAGFRNQMEVLGLWQNPTPLIPSDHLAQTLAVLDRYGWGRSVDFSPTGRMCIRGAQTFLAHTGHVTPAGRARAVAYLQLSLNEIGVQMPFFAWNDLPERTFPDIEKRLNRAAYLARTNGE